MAKKKTIESPVVICTYRVKKGKESKFRDLLSRHWPTLEKHGLVEPEAPQHFEAKDEGGGTTFTEIFRWKGEKWQDAHEIPDVLAIWEPMETLCEARNGGRPMCFHHVAPAAIPLAKVESV